MTLREINARQSLIRKYDQSAPKISRVELLATRKIITYILIYLIQWTPVLIYVGGEAFHVGIIHIKVSIYLHFSNLFYSFSTTQYG